MPVTMLGHFAVHFIFLLTVESSYPQPTVNPVSIVSRIWSTDAKCAPCGRYPWFAQIKVSSRRDSNSQRVCGGTLIAPYTVLSAAHCFIDLERDQRVTNRTVKPILDRFNAKQALDIGVEVRFGRCHYTDPSHVLYATSVSLHTQHGWSDTGGYSYDAAIVRLAPSGANNNTEFINFTTAGENSRLRSATAIGWGLTQFGLPARCLRAANVAVHSRAKCKRLLGAQGVSGFNDQTMICAGDKRRDACRGDSGGPLLVVKDHEHQEVAELIQIGIVSFGHPYKCASKSFPTVYTRLSAIVPWIQQVIGECV